jgi:hypothetical protein
MANGPVAVSVNAPGNDAEQPMPAAWPPASGHTPEARRPSRDATWSAYLDRLPSPERLPVLFSYCAVNLGLLFASRVLSDVWSVYQGRHLFPCIPSFLIACRRGVEWAVGTRKWAPFIVNGFVGAAHSTIIACFGVEIILKLS